MSSVNWLLTWMAKSTMWIRNDDGFPTQHVLASAIDEGIADVVNNLMDDYKGYREPEPSWDYTLRGLATCDNQERAQLVWESYHELHGQGRQIGWAFDSLYTSILNFYEKHLANAKFLRDQLSAHMCPDLVGVCMSYIMCCSDEKSIPRPVVRPKKEKKKEETIVWTGDSTNFLLVSETKQPGNLKKISLRY